MVGELEHSAILILRVGLLSGVIPDDKAEVAAMLRSCAQLLEKVAAHLSGICVRCWDPPPPRSKPRDLTRACPGVLTGKPCGRPVPSVVDLARELYECGQTSKDVGQHPAAIPDDKQEVAVVFVDMGFALEALAAHVAGFCVQCWGLVQWRQSHPAALQVPSEPELMELAAMKLGVPAAELLRVRLSRIVKDLDKRATTTPPTTPPWTTPGGSSTH